MEVWSTSWTLNSTYERWTFSPAHYTGYFAKFGHLLGCVGHAQLESGQHFHPTAPRYWVLPWAQVTACGGFWSFSPGLHGLPLVSSKKPASMCRGYTKLPLGMNRWCSLVDPSPIQCLFPANIQCFQKMSRSLTTLTNTMMCVLSQV